MSINTVFVQKNIENTDKSDNNHTNGGKVEMNARGDRGGDSGVAKIKAEFINHEYKPKLMYEYLPQQEAERLDKLTNKSDGTGEEPPMKRKKIHGQNKKRRRAKKEDPKTRLCSSIMAEVQCRFGSSCKFSHDVNEYMSKKPPDIHGTCPNFVKSGKCPYGVTCRYARSHLTDEYKNVINPETLALTEGKNSTKNKLEKNILLLLRKHQYDFCKANSIFKSVRMTKTLANDQSAVVTEIQTAMGQPPIMIGKAFIVTEGQPTTVTGQPLIVTGQPTTVMGQPLIVTEGKPPTVTGQPLIVTQGKTYVVTGQPPVVPGQPLIVTQGQPPTVTGQPLIVTEGQPPTVTGQPLIVTQGQTSVVTGQPLVVTGQPLIVTQGQPPTVTGQPLIVTKGQPPTVTGQPLIATQGKPTTVTGQPLIVTEQPHTMIGQPLILTGQPHTLTEKPPIVTSQHSIMTGQPHIVTEGKPLSSVSTQCLSETASTSSAAGLGCVTDVDVIKLRPSERKTIRFEDKLYLAPLTTVGNLPFRRVCKRFGADITCGEMALSTQLLQAQQSEWALLRRHESEDVFGVQICGAYPDTMTRCAQLLNEQTSIDFIDINVGCPIDLVFNKGEGSALMGRVTRFEKIVRSIKEVSDVPVTVKMRTGIYENKNVAHNLIPKLKDWGASLITVHGRTREQRYTKLANWDYISQCAELAKPVPFFGNGDILSYEDANLRRESTGVTGLMIARGALIKPWIFTEIKEQRHWDISSSERFEILREFTNNGLEHWGSDSQGVETTRRFMLEWLSFLHRYIPVGILEHVPQKLNQRPPPYLGRDDLETMMGSGNSGDWVKISEMLLGPVPDGFTFLPKHKANSYK